MFLFQNEYLNICFACRLCVELCPIKIRITDPIGHGNPIEGLWTVKIAKMLRFIISKMRKGIESLLQTLSSFKQKSELFEMANSRFVTDIIRRFVCDKSLII